jgi:UPF0176 protein
MPRTASFYCFADLPDHAERVAPLQALCTELDVRGNILLAAEGINGSIAGDDRAVQAVLDHLREDPRLAALAVRSADCAEVPLHRLKVRSKREIVTLGVPGLDPVGQTGTHVPPSEWNALLQRPGLVLLDVRNDYEVAIGSFEGAVDPQTAAFTDWPAWIAAQSAPGGLLHGQPAVAMFCTGGIRCEKASSLMRAQGFGEVYQLEGGILNYLEQVPATDSRWHGECFVFDERVAVGHGLAAGSHSLCRSCRRPLNEADRAAPQFEEGVQCAHCADQRDDRQRQGYRERQRQMALAAERGATHLGLPPAAA